MLLKSQTVRDTEHKRSYQKWLCCKASMKKRGSATFFSATSSHGCLSSFSVWWHVILLLKLRIQVEHRQAICVDRIHRTSVQIESRPARLILLFWQFVGVKELNSAEVTQICRVALRVLKVSSFKRLFVYDLVSKLLSTSGKESHTNFKHTEEEKLLTEAFLFSRSRKQQLDMLQVTSVLSQRVTLFVWCVLSQTMWFIMFRWRGAALQMWGSLVLSAAVLSAASKEKKEVRKQNFFLLHFDRFLTRSIDSFFFLRISTHNKADFKVFSVQEGKVCGGLQCSQYLLSLVWE